MGIPAKNNEILTKNGRSRQIMGDFTLKSTFQQIDQLFGLKDVLLTNENGKSDQSYPISRSRYAMKK